MAHEYYLKKVANKYRLFDNKNRQPRAVSRFLEHLEIRNLSAETVRSYGYDLLYLHRWLCANKITWKRFSEKDIVKFVRFQTKAKASAKTINRRLTTCGLFYKSCFGKPIQEISTINKSLPYYKGRGLDKNLGLFYMSKPIRMKFKVKEPKKLFEVLKPNEISDFKKGLKRHRDLAIIALMLYCGLRFSEVLTLKTKNIDYLEKKLIIDGKGSKQRIVYLTDDLIKIFDDYTNLERPPSTKSEFFFLILQGKQKGNKMTKAGLRSLFRYRRLASKVKKANPHRFRHTFGSAMAGANVSLPILQTLMGHADPITTLNYIHLSSPDLANEFNRATKEIKKKYGN